MTAPAADPVAADWASPTPDWHADALCRQIGGDVWFPEKGESTRGAKAVCARCPVTADCLRWALDHDERFGVWGGLSERERRPLRGMRGGAGRLSTAGTRAARDQQIRTLASLGLGTAQIATRTGSPLYTVQRILRETA